MKIGREIRRVADTLASVFAIHPRTDYRAGYRRRSAEEMMNRAWAKTMSDLNSAIEGYGRRERSR